MGGLDDVERAASRAIVQNRPGAVADLLAALSEAGIGLRSILGWARQNVLQVVVTDSATAAEALAGHGIAFTEHDAQIVELANQPGALHTYLAALAHDSVNLRSLSGFASADGTSCQTRRAPSALATRRSLQRIGSSARLGIFKTDGGSSSPAQDSLRIGPGRQVT